MNPVRADGLRVTKTRGSIWSVQIAYQRDDLQASVICSCPKRLFPIYEQFFLATCHSLKLTEQPRNLEEELLKSMPQLVNEIRNGPRDYPRIREFFVLPNRRVILGGSTKERFIYYEEDHDDLQNQLDLLEEAGLVKDVTPIDNNVPIYRFTARLLEKIEAR
jgi:hypothetical protein